MSATDECRLGVNALRRVCSIDHFNFESTAELPYVHDIIGQPRGVKAIEFGIDISSRGYNIYVLGPTGTGRLTAIEYFLKGRAKAGDVPADWVYVHNFETPHKPLALSLSPGVGSMLQSCMVDFVNDIRREIPRVLQTKNIRKQIDLLKRDFEQKRSDLLKALGEEAEKVDFALAPTQAGLQLIPLQDGEPLQQEAFLKLSPEKRKALEERQRELEQQLEDVALEVRAAEKETIAAARALETGTAGEEVTRLLQPIREQCAQDEEVLVWLDSVQKDVLDKLDLFKTAENENANADDAAQQLADRENDESGFHRYQVNLFVDHSSTSGAPVVVEDLPTYQNLVGRIEAEMHFGSMSADFTMIKPGTLHRANGGYLVLRAADLLQQPFAWDGLKRALSSGEIRIEESETQTGTGVIVSQRPEPQPIPLSVKVILMGNPSIYYMLHESDEDFPELFKVKADFASTMERNHATEDEYASFIAARCHEEDLPHFNPAAVARMVEYGSWLADDQNKLTTRFGELTDLVLEAAYWARSVKRELVNSEDVSRAINERVYRANLIEERVQERIQEGKIFIDTSGEVVGQVNGLSVLTLGDHSFGQPNRVTARVYMGKEGVLNIEREVGTAGPIHNKGLLTLRGYLGGQYAGEHPLSLTASLTFEQNYSGIEGDSASSTELYALLSALANVPIRQDLAVTGSVNQHGAIQPIGGATQKVEGFFDICQTRGLTGTQGALIPSSNVVNLMLREDVLKAVEDEQFHIYAVETIDQGIEILTGISAGKRSGDGTYPDGTLHQMVQVRLRELADGLEEFSGFRSG